MEHSNNDEKILQILSELKAEMTEMKAEMADMKAKTDRIETDVKFTKEIVIKIENDHGQKLNALFDGYSANYDSNKEIELRIIKLEKDVEKLKFEVSYFKPSVSK